MHKAQNGESRTAVLVVDDEPLVRMDLAAILEDAGFEVTEAGNSDEALRKLNGGGYRLGALVTDVQMPGAMNGYLLAKYVYQRYPEAAIVVVSGVVQPSPEDMPPNAIFLAKPVSPERLVKALNDSLLGPG
jgi:CheY-like chemotaxis protein